MNIINFNFSLFDWFFNASVTAKCVKEDVEGFSNRCTDGKYVMAIDYDNIKLEWLKKELVHLKDIFKLGNIYIIQSSKKGFHAVCFDKLPFEVYKTILFNSSADYNYITVPLKYGYKTWVLRSSKKRGFQPVVVDTIKSVYEGKRQRSKPHIAFFNKWYNQKIGFNNCDNSIEMLRAFYRT